MCAPYIYDISRLRVKLICLQGKLWDHDIMMITITQPSIQ